jgi:hypothetical protein
MKLFKVIIIFSICSANCDNEVGKNISVTENSKLKASFYLDIRFDICL